MRVLLGCVNSAVSLVGYDVEQRQAFWYCPGNVLRVCGVCRHEGALYVASDSMLQRLDATGIEAVRLPGPHENLAHSVKPLGASLLGIADTGNSRILLHSGGPASLALSPLEGWGDTLPLDAIHLNDFVPWHDGVLASAFNHQPFDRWKRSSLAWKKEGWGLIFHLRRHQGHTLARIVAGGLNCPTPSPSMKGTSTAAPRPAGNSSASARTNTASSMKCGAGGSRTATSCAAACACRTAGCWGAPRSATRPKAAGSCSIIWATTVS